MQDFQQKMRFHMKIFALTFRRTQLNDVLRSLNFLKLPFQIKLNFGCLENAAQSQNVAFCCLLHSETLIDEMKSGSKIKSIISFCIFHFFQIPPWCMPFKWELRKKWKVLPEKSILRKLLPPPWRLSLSLFCDNKAIILSEITVASYWTLFSRFAFKKQHVSLIYAYPNTLCLLIPSAKTDKK
jgi:hypothetical protein